MVQKWRGTPFPGVRYREHPKRKHGVKLDRYFVIRYRLNGKQKQEALGWSSQGWTAQKAATVLSDLKKSHVLGEGPQSLNEKREAEVQRRELEEREKARTWHRNRH